MYHASRYGFLSVIILETQVIETQNPLINLDCRNDMYSHIYGFPAITLKTATISPLLIYAILLDRFVPTLVVVMENFR